MKDNRTKFLENKSSVFQFSLKSYYKQELDDPPAPNKPERNLVAAIIGRAIVDAYCEAEITQSVRREARAWLKGDCCKQLCQILDLSHPAMLQAIANEPQIIVYRIQETSSKFYQKRCKK